MRYACLNHSAELTCSGDQGNWCMWHEPALGGKGHCELYFSDADFVHFLMWSSAKLACAGSEVAQIVQCSFEVSDTDCETRTGCKWKEGACYPGWYPVTDPGALRKFKKQVCQDSTQPILTRQTSCPIISLACMQVSAFCTAHPSTPLNLTRCPQL